MRATLTALLITIATQVTAETTFDFDNETYSVNLFNLYCPAKEGSVQAKLIEDDIDFLKSQGKFYPRVYQIWCDGATTTAENNRLTSVIRVSPNIVQLPDLPDEKLQQLLNSNLEKNIDKLFLESKNSRKNKDYTEFLKSQAGILRRESEQFLIQLDPIPVIGKLQTIDLENEQVEMISYATAIVKNGKMFSVYLDDFASNPIPHDQVRLVSKIASSIKKKKPKQNLSNLSDKEQAGINGSFLNAIRPYWRLAPNSPGYNAVIIVRVEFNETGTVKKNGIKWISTKSGSNIEGGIAVRTAGKAILMASNAGNFKFPADKFEEWKVLELEFDPKSMRK